MIVYKSVGVNMIREGGQKPKKGCPCGVLKEKRTASTKCSV